MTTMVGGRRFCIQNFPYFKHVTSALCLQRAQENAIEPLCITGTLVLAQATAPITGQTQGTCTMADGDPQATIAKLRSRVAELEEENRALKVALANAKVDAAASSQRYVSLSHPPC